MKKQYLYAGLSVFSWGTMAPVSKVLLSDMSNMQVLGYGSFIGAMSLLGILIGTKQRDQLREYTFTDIGKRIVLGAIGYFAYSALYYQGLSILPSQTACILNYLWPIFSVLFAWIFLHESLSKSSIFAILLSFIGVGVVVFQPGESLPSQFLLGSLYCIVAAALYGLFTILRCDKVYSVNRCNTSARKLRWKLTCFHNVCICCDPGTVLQTKERGGVNG